jgi:hypothetical protein
MLELLPEDVQYRIISQLDWCSIPSAALTCTLWRDLVRRHSNSVACSPQWSQNLVRGDPNNPTTPMSELAREDCFAFVSQLLAPTGYLQKSCRPDVVIVTATPGWQPRLKTIQKNLLDLLPNSKSVHILCLVAAGIVGTDSEGASHEVEYGEDGLAIALLHLSPTQLVLSSAIQGSEMSRKDRQAYIDDANATTKAIEAHMQENYLRGLSGRPEKVGGAELERNVSCFLVGDTYDHLDVLKLGLEKRLKKMHTIGGLVGYDMRETNIFFSSPDSRAGRILPQQRAKVRAAAILISNVRSTNATVAGLHKVQSDYRVVKMMNNGIPGAEVIRGVSLQNSMLPYSTVCKIAKILDNGEVATEEEPANRVLRDTGYGSVENYVLFAIQHETTNAPIDSQSPPTAESKREQVAAFRFEVDSEGIHLPMHLKGGERCSVYTRTAEASLEELSSILSTLRDSSGQQDRTTSSSSASSTSNNNKQASLNNNCFGAIMVICTARGSNVHEGEVGVETALIQKALPSLPIIGFFANGELGPLPYREWKGDHANKDMTSTVIQGNTTVLSFLRANRRDKLQINRM